MRLLLPRHFGLPLLILAQSCQNKFGDTVISPLGSGSSAAASASAPATSSVPTISSAPASSQSVAPYPTGIFCSCSITNATKHSVDPNVAALPFVKGILIRPLWSDLEPTPGTYSWSNLDNEIALAAKSNKQVSLAVLDGPNAPSWLSGQGAKTFSVTLKGAAATIPVPWDPVYLAEWAKFVAALGARYANNPNLVLVHITHSSMNGMEMFLSQNESDTAKWIDAGYTQAKMSAALVRVIDAFMAAFPKTPLDIEVHPVLILSPTEHSVADQAVAYLTQKAGSRGGVFAAWWSQVNTVTYPEMFNLVRQQASSTFATVQFAQSEFRLAQTSASQTKQKKSAKPTFVLSDAIQSALSNNIHYLEIWNADLTNPPYATLLSTTASTLAAP